MKALVDEMIGAVFCALWKGEGWVAALFILFTIGWCGRASAAGLLIVALLGLVSGLVVVIAIVRIATVI